jgi:hypothetical protein
MFTEAGNGPTQSVLILVAKVESAEARDAFKVLSTGTAVRN